jgi:hypothetical protein
VQAWLYQMSAQLDPKWGPAEYRAQAWEDTPITWPTHRVTGGVPAIGDVVVTFFAPSGNPDPGIYGLGIITNVFPSRDHFEFRLCPPSDQLKTVPMWDTRLKRLVDRVRGRVKQGTLWPIDRTAFDGVQKRIRSHLGAA